MGELAGQASSSEMLGGELKSDLEYELYWVPEDRKKWAQEGRREHRKDNKNG